MTTSPLKYRYQMLCYRRSDINEHLPVLLKLTQHSQVHTIVELGTRNGVSTTAFLLAAPRRLICYDLSFQSAALRLRELNPPDTLLEFRTIDTRRCGPTLPDNIDLAFFDTIHTFKQVRAELKNVIPHMAPAPSPAYLVFHDTETFGRVGMDGGAGILLALQLGIPEEWQLVQNYKNNNGLRIYERKTNDSP